MFIFIIMQHYIASAVVIAVSNNIRIIQIMHFCVFRVKSDIAHQLLLKLYLRIPGLIQHLVDVELDKFLAGACVTGNMDTPVIV
jgi:hypothetical protein